MSEPVASGLFEELFHRGPVREATTDGAWIAALLRFERALAASEATAGIIPATHAAAIDAACTALDVRPAEIGAEATLTGTPVLPILAAVRARLDPVISESLHRGATSQDAMDSATMVVAAAAVDVLVAELEAAADGVAALAGAHRGTEMTARTLLRQALPSTFGALAVSWLAGLDAAVERLRWVRSERLAVQLGGPVGTLAAFGPRGQDVVSDVAGQLGLAVPEQPWHTERGRVVDLASALGAAAAAVGKPALDLVLLGQDELGEVRDTDPDRGGSSAMAHKRNPVAAVLARACALQAAGQVATILTTAGQQELHRAAGAWHAEWLPVRDLLRTVGSGVSWLRDAIEHLEVDTERMRANLEVAMAGIDGSDGEIDPGSSTLTLVNDALARHARLRHGSRDR